MNEYLVKQTDQLTNDEINQLVKLTNNIFLAA